MSTKVLDEINNPASNLRTPLLKTLEYLIGSIFFVETIALIYMIRYEFSYASFFLFSTFIFIFILSFMLLTPILYIISWRSKSLDVSPRINDMNPLWLFFSPISGGLSIFLGFLITFPNIVSINSLKDFWFLLLPVLLVIFGILFLLYVWKTTALIEQWNSSKKEDF